MGKTSEKSKEEIETLEKYFKKYNEFLVHTRYATFGSKEELLKGAQPITTSGFKINGKYSYSEKAKSAIVHNGQLVSIEDLSEEFPNITGNDTEFLLRMYEKCGIEKVIENIPAAYSAIISDKERVTGFRDRYGIRPLWYGEKDGFPVLASEDSCIKKIGGKPVREIKPGEVVYVEDGEIDFEKVGKTNEKFCFLNIIISQILVLILMGKMLGEVRKELGRKLAKEAEIEDADLVIPVPNSGRFYAIGYQEETGLPYSEALKKKIRI